MVRIEINYLAPDKPKGMVGPKQTIHVGETFEVFSDDGPMTFEFKGPSAVASASGPLRGGVNHVAGHAGDFRFACKLHVAGSDVVIDSAQPGVIGGELEVIP